MTLESSGVVTHSERAIPEPLAVIITGAFMLIITWWVIWIDYYIAIQQRICENRGREIEIEFLGRNGVIGRIVRAQTRDLDMFLLGRGLLIILTLAWIIVFGSITLSL